MKIRPILLKYSVTYLIFIKYNFNEWLIKIQKEHSTNTADTEAPFLGLSISNVEISIKNHDKRDNWFLYCKFSQCFLDGDVPHPTSCGVYISQLIYIARVSS